MNNNKNSSGIYDIYPWLWGRIKNEVAEALYIIYSTF